VLRKGKGGRESSGKSWRGNWGIERERGKLIIFPLQGGDVREEKNNKRIPREKRAGLSEMPRRG